MSSSLSEVRPMPKVCPGRNGVRCNQRVELVLDGNGSVDRDWVKCLFHGEVFVGVQPDLDPPGDSPKAGKPTTGGMRL